MPLVTRILGAAVAACLLAGCTVYPTSRTFYEPMADEGKLRNQPGCKFIHTHDTVQTQVGSLRVSVLVGPERSPVDRAPDLTVTLSFDGPAGSWDLNTDKVVIVLGRSGKVLRRDLATDSAVAGATRWSLHYPEPAGLEDRVEVRFEPGALLIDGKSPALEPLHFRRVTRKDVLVGPFDCVG